MVAPRDQQGSDCPALRHLFTTVSSCYSQRSTTGTAPSKRTLLHHAQAAPYRQNVKGGYLADRPPGNPQKLTAATGDPKRKPRTQNESNRLQLSTKPADRQTTDTLTLEWKPSPRLVTVAMVELTLASPKSEILATQSSSSRMFRLFRSRCKIPRWCKSCMPCFGRRTRTIACVPGGRGVYECERSARRQYAQGKRR